MNLKTLSQEAKEIQKRSDPEWYFSEEGKAAYIAADTPAKKTKYFFDYLMAVRDKKATPEKAKDTFFKIAVVMASTMDNSSLEFAGYPNILQKEKPLHTFFGGLSSSPLWRKRIDIEFKLWYNNFVNIQQKMSGTWEGETSVHESPKERKIWHVNSLETSAEESSHELRLCPTGTKLFVISPEKSLVNMTNGST